MTQPEVTFPLRVELPKGQWADLRDPEDVSERQRRAIQKAQMRMALHAGKLTQAQQLIGQIQDVPDGEIDADTEKAATGLFEALVESGAFDASVAGIDVALAALIDSWSYDKPITVDTIVDLPGAAYDALRTAALPLVPRLSPDFDPNPDPESPTPPSSD